jgi:hypothetical protein
MKLLDIQKYIKNDHEETTEPSQYTKYYLDRFSDHINTDWFVSWNWSAFLMPLVWSSHRKMYGLSLGYLVGFYPFYLAVCVFTGVILGMLGVLPVGIGVSYLLLFLSELSIRLFLGLYGNAIYLKNLRARVISNSNRRGTSDSAPIMALFGSWAINMVWLFYGSIG